MELVCLTTKIQCKKFIQDLPLPLSLLILLMCCKSVQTRRLNEQKLPRQCMQ